MNGTVSGRFAVPRQRKSLVARPRLTRKLHAGIGTGLAVVHAPVGFGKTTLLAAFAGEIEEHFSVRWLSLDASASSPEVFAQQLAIALLGEDVPEPATADKLDDLRAYLGVALRRAEESAGLPPLLILDNVHEIAGAQDTCEVLAWFIESLPDGAEVVAAGRALPPLTLISQRVAMGDCVLIESAELAFSLEEIAVLLPEHSPLDAHELLAATDGWPAAVMATIAGGVTVPGRGLSRANAAWEEFVGSEVWGSIPAELQPAMLRIAVPYIVSDALGAKLLGRAQWLALRRWLALHDFLYEPLSDEGLRLNPLLRRFLVVEAQRTEEARFEDTVRAVAEHLELNGDIAEAIEIARDAGSVDVLVALARTHSRHLLHQGAFLLLRRAYDAIPQEVLQATPLLDAMHARVLAHTGRPGEALDIVEDILARESASREAKIHALLAKYRALRLLGRPDQLAQIFEDARDLGATLDASLAAELAYNEAHLVLGLDSNFKRAQELFREALAYCRVSRSPTLELLARSSLGQLLAMRGDCPAAVAELTQSARGWREVGGSSNLGWVLNNLGMAHLSVGDFESAVVALEEARREGEACENTRNFAYATASLADAELALGRFDRAKDLYSEAIRLCSEEVPDESLASLSIAGLAGALLGLGDLQEADFFAQRALYIAESVGNPYEVGMCLVQHAAIASAAQDHTTALGAARHAIQLFETIDGESSLRIAYYRLAVVQFRANRRGEAQATLQDLAVLIREPWMLGALLPAVREQPMFAQWVASRGVLGPAFRELLERNTFGEATHAAEELPGRIPRVIARSLGQLRVAVGGREVSDEAWASARAKELFFLFLANRTGIRKEEAVDRLYPDLEPEKCNSAFHSNLYRIRRALYQDSVVKKDGAYMLNPDGEFDWDLERFEHALDRAAELPPGSDERAKHYREALALYRGPFAEAFYSEWAESLRRRVEERAQEALSTLAGYYAGREDYEAAAGVMEQLLERNRFNEEAAYRLITYRARAGNPAGALAFLDDYSATYRRDLG
ncbi:MAG: tetratricopeptide repeat protein, partial [Dehalococcoidia bacterium]|nr:tetratricopeptide repeat protein [Dehalococcoidia bacterium]